jgi:amino acid adenylation domain-containing protein
VAALSKITKRVGDRSSRVFLCLEDLLSHYRRVSPDRNAILAPGHAPVTYGAFWGLVDDVVRGLRRLGVSRSDRVAVVLPNGPEAAVAIVAVATAARCVPLNPSFTADEWHRYFGDLQITALLTRADLNSACRSVAHALSIAVVDLPPLLSGGCGGFKLVGPRTRRAVRSTSAPSPENDAFILLTSGTASHPKMVPLTHASVCLSAYNAGAALALGPRDRLLNVLPLYHAHGLISGLLAALAAGSTVVCTPGFDCAAFFGWLTEFRPTWYTAVPTIHRALLSAVDRDKRSVQRHSLRVIRSASASLPPVVLGELESLFGVPVIETYGMTEAASQVAANPPARRKPGSVGQPAGAEIAIMDREGRRLAAGERGEIALRGPTIAKGYDNDIAATQSAFRDGWFLTGDLGYLDRDGYLFIVGRIKDVIKRGGQQVAPAEVEEALLSHPDVVEAAAFAIAHERLGEDVAAAVVLRPGTEVSAQELRKCVSERLAAYKVPGLIRIVPEIPKSSAGKIKRSRLAAELSISQPNSRAEHGNKLVPPRSDLEGRLAKLWAELLELTQIDVDQDVFALGADSLKVTQMLSRLHEHFACDLSFKDILDAPTVADLAAHLEASARKPAGLSLHVGHMSAETSGIPLSFQQQRLYLLNRLDPTLCNYHVVEVARLSGPLDRDALETSIAMICQRHEALRSNFLERQGEPMQTVGTVWPRLEVLDLQPCARSRRAAAVRRQARALLHQSLDIEKDVLLRVQLLRLDEHDHALVIKLHHLVTDGWSQRLFWEELEVLYRGKLRGTLATLPELPMQYRDFVAWQRAWLRTPAAEAQLSYWRTQLKGAAELPLRTDRPRPDARSGRGARYPLKLSANLSAEIRSLSRAHSVTLFMTLLAALQCLLHRYTEHDDVAVGSLIANRNQIQFERLIGMFANTIVLRTALSGDPTFGEVLRRVRQVTLDAYRNQDLPIEKILQALQLPRSVDRNPLFRVMFILQSASSRAAALPGLRTRFVDVDPGIARFDLALELVDADQGLSGWLEYDTDVFEVFTIARMTRHLLTLLEAIVANPEERISRLSLLPEEERKRVLIDWNDTRTRFARSDTFCRRFAIQVARSPLAPAVSSGRARLSYQTLARRSEAIAQRLAIAGVGPEVVVALLAERDLDLLAAMVAVQQAGGAFLSLDPTLPAARLAHIIRSSRAALVLAGPGCDSTLDAALSGMPARELPQVVRIEELGDVVRLQLAPLARPSPSNLAYVIYTSGSTGVPKGAMIEQRGMFNHLLSQISDLQLSALDVIAQTAPQSYVISVWQFLTPLMIGARVHICADALVRDPALLAQEVVREGVTILQVVPALLRRILERTPNEPVFRALSRLRCLISTGEPLTADLCRDWFRYFPDVPLMNAYGSAECSDDVATYRLTAPPASLAHVPIGRAIANTRLYVLDAHLAPVPIGVVGELFVGGIGVGRGYLNDSQQTQRSFLRDPLSKRSRGRLYRTGDLARWRTGGTLECLGRADHQVKIRGYRIELGEIEHVLEEHPDVQGAVVLARHAVGGEARLVAYVVAAADRQPNVNALRDFLKARVPGYMIPAGFIFLKRMPRTAHGKIDRRALAAIRRGIRVAEGGSVAPRNSVEQILANIWVDLLGVEDVGVLSNFFELGGQSLLAGRVLARVANDLGVSLPIRALFEAPTIEALARRVQQVRETDSNKPQLEIARVREGAHRHVSVAQEHMLNIERKLPGLPQFNLPFAYRLRGPLSVPALARSLAEVVRRHESLRTGFAWAGEQPIALIAPVSEADAALTVEDLAAETRMGGGRTKALLLKKAELRAEQLAWTPFEMTRVPLFRTRLFRLGPEDHVLVMVLHHIIVDGWSIGVLFEEVTKLYSAFVSGRQAQLPWPALQFRDLAHWQRRWCTTAAATRQLAYWKEQLRGASPVFRADCDLAAALLASRTSHEPIHLSDELLARLDALGRSRGATLFMTLLAGFKIMLLAQTGRNDICIATAMANRTQQRTELVIGPLENTVLIRTRMDLELSFPEALDRVRDAVLDAHANQELPFGSLTSTLAENPGSLIQVFFVLQNALQQRLELSGVEVRSFGDVYREGQAVLPIDRSWLTVMLKERPSGITGSCRFKDDLFEANTVEHWMVHYKSILAKAAATPEMSLARLAAL